MREIYTHSCGCRYASDGEYQLCEEHSNVENLNLFEQKQEERRQRYLDRAEGARQEANSRGKAAFDMAHMMNGQPILIGHHSEKRHRRDIERMDNNLHRAVEADKRADHYEHKASSVGKGGVSQDDPEAIQKLKAKLQALENRQEFMKTINAAWRKVGKPKPDNKDAWDEIAQLTGLTSVNIDDIRLNMARDFLDRAPFSYHMQNNSANIRSVKERIKALERAQDEPERGPIQGQGFTITENRDENRILFEFDQKPPREVCQIMRSNGWRFSRRLMAWVRFINNTSRFSAECVTSQLEGMTLTS